MDEGAASADPANAHATKQPMLPGFKAPAVALSKDYSRPLVSAPTAKTVLVPVVYRAMTAGEFRMASLLEPGRVSYRVGSWDKRFAREMAGGTSLETSRITDRQAEALRKLAHRYRRQAPEAHRLAGCCGIYGKGQK